MEKLKENLKRKGWSDAEIEKTINMIHHSATHPHYIQQKSSFNRLLYWMSLLLLAICNFIISIFLVPFIILFPSKFIYLILVPLALIFGYMFATIINSIEHLEIRHHITAMILLPIITIINFFIIVQISDFLSGYLKINIRHDPIMIALIYSAFLIIPYFIFLAIENKKPRIKNLKR